MSDFSSKIREFMLKNRSRCFALADWKNLQMKDYSVKEMLECICGEAEGSIKVMEDIVDRLTAKRRVSGRTQVHASSYVPDVDIVRSADGTLKVVGYGGDANLPLKGQKVQKNPKIFRRDGQVNRNFKRSEGKMMDFGQKVREMYPDGDNHFITFAMQAIKKYAEGKKMSPDRVLDAIRKGRYTLDTSSWTVVPSVSESKRRVIVINESDAERLGQEMRMTEHKFFVNIKTFIAQLLQDPVNAKVPRIFADRGYTRSSLLSYLLAGKDPILKRSQRISDRDENGEPKTATMKVRFERPDFKGKGKASGAEYLCSKKNFERKLEKLYIRMFEKNLPKRGSSQDTGMDEATGCGSTGAAGGTFISPLSTGVIRRQMPTEIGESTSTANTGDYTYDAPVLGDKETFARHNGKGGSVSVNIAK